jgi:hypothetical protein
MATDSKKSFPNKSYKNSKYTVINWWNKQHLQSKFLFLIIICLGLIAVVGLAELLGPDENTQKINAINQMSTALKTAQPIITDLHNSLSAYDTGKTDSNTAIKRLQADKTIIDGLISKMRSTKPPDELQHSYSVTLSTLQYLSTSLGFGIDGIKTNNFLEIEQTIGLKDNLTVKFNEAADEVSKLRYPTNSTRS